MTRNAPPMPNAAISTPDTAGPNRLNDSGASDTALRLRHQPVR